MGGPILECLFDVLFFGYLTLNFVAMFVALMKFTVNGEREPFPTRGSQVFFCYGLTIWFLNFLITPRKKSNEKI